MIQATPHMRILVSNQAVDFRKGIDGLVRTCWEALQCDPFSGIMFIFRNRRRTGIKILIYDGQGFWLAHKRLSTGTFRWWPVDRDTGRVELEAHDLQVLLAAGHPQTSGAPGPWRKINSGTR